MTFAVNFAHPHITYAQLEAELRRELSRRHGFYPRQVGKGAMLQADADRELALCAAWLEDLLRARAIRVDRAAENWRRYRAGDMTAGDPPPAAHGLRWSDRRSAVLRELALRQRVYPRGIEKGEITREDAAHRIDCLEALLGLYEDGWDWVASNGYRPGFDDPAPTPAAIEARGEWDEMRGLRAQRQPVEQKEMFA